MEGLRSDDCEEGVFLPPREGVVLPPREGVVLPPREGVGVLDGRLLCSDSALAIGWERLILCGDRLSIVHSAGRCS